MLSFLRDAAGMGVPSATTYIRKKHHLACIQQCTQNAHIKVFPVHAVIRYEYQHVVLTLESHVVIMPLLATLVYGQDLTKLDIDCLRRRIAFTCSIT